MKDATKTQAWAEKWMSTISDASMTQRRLTSVERYGGLDALTTVAEAHGVHLVELTDDEGNTLIAARRHPFKVLC